MSEVTTEKVYQTTYEQCQKTITGICSCCGVELKPLETVDNSGNPTWWAGCEPCNRFDAGVSPEVYAIAKYLVDETGFIAYDHMERPKSNDADYAKYYHESQIGGASALVFKILAIQRKLNPDAYKIKEAAPDMYEIIKKLYDYSMSTGCKGSSFPGIEAIMTKINS